MSHHVVLFQRLRVNVVRRADVAHELYVEVIFRKKLCLRRRRDGILGAWADLDDRGHVLGARQRPEKVGAVAPERKGKDDGTADRVVGLQGAQ